MYLHLKLVNYYSQQKFTGIFFFRQIMLTYSLDLVWGWSCLAQFVCMMTCFWQPVSRTNYLSFISMFTMPFKCSEICQIFLFPRASTNKHLHFYPQKSMLVSFLLELKKNCFKTLNYSVSALIKSTNCLTTLISSCCNSWSFGCTSKTGTLWQRIDLPSIFQHQENFSPNCC